MSTAELGRVLDHHTTMAMVVNQTKWWSDFAVGCVCVTAAAEGVSFAGGLHGVYTPVGRVVGAIRMTALTGVSMGLIGVCSSLTDMYTTHANSANHASAVYSDARLRHQ